MTGSRAAVLVALIAGVGTGLLRFFDLRWIVAGAGEGVCVDGTRPEIVGFIQDNAAWLPVWGAAFVVFPLLSQRIASEARRRALVISLASASMITFLLAFASLNQHALGIGCTWWRSGTRACVPAFVVTTSGQAEQVPPCEAP